MKERNIVFLYAGQGSQKVGMGQDFYQAYPEFRDFVDAVELPFDAKKLMFEGPIEMLSQTQYTQGCMALFAAGVTKLLFKEGIIPAAVCGLSLGEYGALHAAGAWDAETYVKLTAYRGQVMMEAAQGTNCSMSAVLGMESEEVEAVLQAYEENGAVEGFVTVANYNCPGQCVLCGDEPAVEALEKQLKEAGAKRCVRLNVSGPFHTKYMAPAGEKLKKYFEIIPFEKPKVDICMNVTGTFLQKEESTPELLVQQVQSSVRFDKQLEALLEKGYDTFVEIGPGNTLSGFLKKAAKKAGREITIYGIDTVADFENCVAKGDGR